MIISDYASPKYPNRRLYDNVVINHPSNNYQTKSSIFVTYNVDIVRFFQQLLLCCVIVSYKCIYLFASIKSVSILFCFVEMNVDIFL